MDAKIMRIARAIHMAKVRECSFPNHDGPWPENRADAMRLFHAGQAWMDIAVAQARAAIKAIEETQHD